MRTKEQHSYARYGLVILIGLAGFILVLYGRQADPLPDVDSGQRDARVAATVDDPSLPPKQPADGADADRPLADSGSPSLRTVGKATLENDGSPPLAESHERPQDDQGTFDWRPSVPSDLPDAGTGEAEASTAKEESARVPPGESARASSERTVVRKPVPAEAFDDPDHSGQPAPVRTSDVETRVPPAEEPAPEQDIPSPRELRESQASEELRVALALQDAGEVVEAHRQLSQVANRHAGTTAARLAQRLLLAADTADSEKAANILRRAAEEQAEGRLDVARHLLEHVATMYRDTPAAEEAIKRLQSLIDAEQTQRARDASERLQEAVAVQENGELDRARLLLERVAQAYRGTAAAEKAEERLRLVSEAERALRAREASERLHEAVAAEENGELDRARALLERVSQTYRDTTVGEEARRRLESHAEIKRKQRQESAADRLREAITAYQSGELTEARRLLFIIDSQYRDTPVHEEAMRLQRQTEQALAEGEGTELLSLAAEAQRQGRPTQARAILERVVRTYQRTAAAKEAANRLQTLQQPPE